MKQIDIGLNVDLPYLEVINSGKLNYSTFLSGYGEGKDIFEYEELDGLDAKRKEPLSISFGAGIPWKRNTIHLKADWHGAVSEYDRLVIPPIETGAGEIKEFKFKDELKSVINFGIGAEIYLNDKVDLFASFSTDYSPQKSSASIFDLVGDADSDINIISDFMHYAIGFDLKFERARITVGGTYSNATGNFIRPGFFPSPNGETSFINDDPSKLTISRWRAIVGLEFPIFGYDVNFK